MGLCFEWRFISVGERGKEVVDASGGLSAGMGAVGGVANARPTRGRLGFTPSQIAHGRSGERNSFERADVALEFPTRVPPVMWTMGATGDALARERGIASREDRTHR